MRTAPASFAFQANDRASRVSALRPTGPAGRGAPGPMGGIQAGPVHLATAQWVSPDWADRAGPGQPRLGSVSKRLGQRAAAYIARLGGPVPGPVACTSDERGGAQSRRKAWIVRPRESAPKTPLTMTNGPRRPRAGGYGPFPLGNTPWSV